jgi:hypothetical protein
MKSRRSFLKKLTAVTTLASLTFSQVKASTKKKHYSNVLIHHVFFWLKNPNNADDKKQFEAAINKLTEIGVIKNSHFGIPAPTEDRDVVDHSYSYSLMLIFNSKKDQDIYQVHPAHKTFVEKNQHLWKRVIVYDSIDI